MNQCSHGLAVDSSRIHFSFSVVRVDRCMLLWISTVGRSPYAVVNTVWAAKRFEGIVPDEVLLFHTGDQDEQIAAELETVRAHLCAILDRHADAIRGVAVDGSAGGFRRQLDEVVFDHRYADWDLALDMTPGRKFMSALVFAAGVKLHHHSTRGAVAVYYLHLKDDRYHGLPFPYIPVAAQELVDIFAEVGF